MKECFCDDSIVRVCYVNILFQSFGQFFPFYETIFFCIVVAKSFVCLG